MKCNDIKWMVNLAYKLQLNLQKKIKKERNMVYYAIQSDRADVLVIC